MKRWRICTTVLLMLALLLSCLPAAAADVAEPDFQALIEQGNTPSDDYAYGMTCSPRFPAFYYAKDLGTAMLCQCADRSFAVYDLYGNLVWKLPSTVTNAEGYRGGFVVVYSGNNTYEIYSATGKLLSDPRYEVKGGFMTFETGDGDEAALVAQTCRDKQTGRDYQMLLRRNSTCMIVSNVSGFYQGMVAYQQKDGLWGVADVHGNEILPNIYHSLEFANDGVLICRKGMLYGLIDLEGNEIVPLEYDELRLLENDGCRRVAALRDGKWGVLDLTGKICVPFASTRPIESGGQTIGKEKIQLYYVTIDGISGRFAEDGAILYKGSPVIPGEITVDTPNRFYIKSTASSKYYTCCNADGEVLPGLEKVYGFTMFGDGYYLSVYDPAADFSGGRIYDLNMNLLAEIENGMYGGIAHQYIGFGWTDDLLAIQTIDYAAVLLYTHDGRRISETTGVYLDNVLHHKTIVIRKGKDSYSFGDGYTMTPYEYVSVRSLNQDRGDGIPLVVAWTNSEESYIYDCQGNRLTDQPVLEIYPREDSGIAGCYHIRTQTQSGFFYICPHGTSFIDNVGASWYHDSVEFCSNAGLMKGVGGGKFAPQTVTTRAMLVQVLYNLSGEKCAAHGFADVPANAWYADAVNWAAANGIVNGVSDTRFAPDDPVTREQMVTILRRYALHFGAQDGAADALDAFADAGSASDYALDALRWAVTVGLVNGTSATQLSPQGSATRAQIATILMRFVRLMAAR